MEYTIIVDGQSYDLPKKTLAVVSQMDEVLKVDANSKLNVRQKFQKCHDFIKGLVGEETAKEMFGSDNLEEIDLTEVTLAVKKVVEAYDKPINDYDNDKTRHAFDDLPIEKLNSIVKAADKVAAIPPQK